MPYTQRGTGWQRTDTSRAAAQRIEPPASSLRQTVLNLLAKHKEGLTSEELAAKASVSYASIQPRTSELRNRGKITDSGARKPNASGRASIVWTLGKDSKQTKGWEEIEW